MVVRRPTTGLLSAGVIALTAAVGVAFWPQLPSEIVTRFSLSGTPATTVSKPVGVFRFPVIMVVTLVVLRGVFRVSPPRTPRTASVIELSTVCVLSALHLLILVWNLGYPVPMDLGYPIPVNLVTLGVVLWVGALGVYLYLHETD